MNVGTIMFAVSVWALPVLLAITLHEAAHGWVAWKLGDDTAYRMGRVTFNPLKHIDRFGTIIMPAMMLFLSGGGMMFGYAKPVPVNFNRLRQPRRDMVLVALAGPGANLLIAFAAAVAANGLSLFSGQLQEWLAYNLSNAVWINVLLCIFNMLPIPPLDGGRVAVGVLPRSLAIPLARLERYGIFIILGGVFILPWIGREIGLDLNVFQWLIIGPAQQVSQFIFMLAGIY